MRTRMTIMGLVVGVVAAGLAVAFVTVLVLGPVVGATLLIVLVALVAAGIRHSGSDPGTVGGAPTPVKSRWRCPETICSPPRAGQTTRAVTIGAPPSEIWPWLVQIGYGRAGWYSYDRIDNDGRPSATRIVPGTPGSARRRPDRDGAGHGPGRPMDGPSPVPPLRRRPRHVVPRSVPERRRHDPAGEPLAAGMEARAGDRVLVDDLRPRCVRDGTQDAPEPQDPGRADR